MSLCTKDTTERSTLIPETGFMGQVKFQEVQEPLLPHYLYDHREPETTNGYYMVRPKETTNLVRNPIFFNDLDLFTSTNTRAVRDTSLSFEGGASLRLSGSGDDVTPLKRGYAQTEIENFSTGDFYTFSAFVYLPQFWDQDDPMLGALSIILVNEAGEVSEYFGERPCRSGGWERVAVSAYITEDTVQVLARLNFRFQQSTAIDACPNDSSEYLYYDMLQFELGSCPTLPFHGDWRVFNMDNEGDFQWEDIPHKSCSMRSSRARSSGELIKFSDYGLSIINHAGHDGFTVQSNNRPFISRTGSSHEGRVESRTLTFTTETCKLSLPDLECCLFQAEGVMVGGFDDCYKDSFLIIYIGDEDAVSYTEDRVMAMIVHYDSGFDYSRSELFRTRMVLQFTATDPVFAFRYPGQDASRLDFEQIEIGNRFVLIDKEGKLQPTSVPPGTDLRTVLVLDKLKFVLGGDYADIGNGTGYLTYAECVDFLDTVTSDGLVRTIVPSNTDRQVIAGGDFTGSLVKLDLITGSLSNFTGYAGTGVNAIVAPYWADVLVGDDANVIHLLFEDVWYTYTANGTIHDLLVDNVGNLYVSGNFTEIDGVTAERVAKLTVIENDCIVLGGQWQSIDYAFDGVVRTMTKDQAGSIYFGGEFTQVTPSRVSICEENNDQGERTSSGGSQRVFYQDLGAGIIRITLYFLSVDARDYLDFVINTSSIDPAQSARAVRISIDGAFGMNDDWYIGQFNTTGLSIPFDGTHHPYELTIDTNIAVPTEIANCQSINESLYGGLLIDPSLVQLRATQDLSNGAAVIGEDNGVNSITVLYAHINHTFIFEAITAHRVIEYDGNNMLPMGDGLPVIVYDLEVAPHTADTRVFAATDPDGTTDGLYMWIGGTWQEFAGQLNILSGAVAVYKISFSPDGDMGLVTNGDGLSVVAGYNPVYYEGNMSQYDLEFVMRGKGILEEIDFISQDCNRIGFFCTYIQDKVLRLTLPNGRIIGEGSPQTHTIKKPSNLAYWLTKGEQNYNAFIDEADCSTEMLLLWRDAYAGMNAMTCYPERDEPCGLQINPLLHNHLPENCRDTWASGDKFISVEGGCPRAFIYIE